VARRNATADTIAQKVHPVGRERKKDLLAHLIKQGDWHQVLVFTRMKHGANRLAEYLNDQGISAMAIHGNKSQGARTKALADFKSGDLQVLVATDIAARGIDIDQLPHVVNFEMPNVPEDYVHRIGRTGRAGATGEAVSLVCLDEEIFLRDIEKLIKRSVPRETIPGFEPPPGEKAEPIVLGRMTIGVGGTKRGGGGGAGHASRGHGGGGRASAGGPPGGSSRSGPGQRSGSGAPSRGGAGAGAGAGGGSRGSGPGASAGSRGASSARSGSTAGGAYGQSSASRPAQSTPDSGRPATTAATAAAAPIAQAPRSASVSPSASAATTPSASPRGGMLAAAARLFGGKR
jgi:ATP-dependent RNA helicase RhlE